MTDKTTTELYQQIADEARRKFPMWRITDDGATVKRVLTDPVDHNWGPLTEFYRKRGRELGVYQT